MAVLLSGILSTFLAFSTITINSVSGSSRYDNDLDEPGIYMANDVPLCTTNQVSCFFSNNNGNTVLTESTSLSINFSTNETFESGNYYHYIVEDTSVSNPLQDIQNQTRSSTSSQTATLTVTWSEICEAMDLGADCATPSSGTAEEKRTLFLIVADDTDLSGEFDSLSIEVGVKDNSVYVDNVVDPGTTDCKTDTTAPGICEFTLFPGDEKAYIQSYSGNSGFPTGRDIDFIQAAAIINEGTCAAITPDYGDPISYISIDTESTSSFLGELPEITGLINDTTYCINFAVVDETNTITGLTADDQDSLSNGEITPSEVAGLLAEGNCFIATATYGSVLHPKLNDFREFRDEFLLEFRWGRGLVDFYYANSKPIALYIQDNLYAKKLSQAMLYPMWLMAKILMSPIWSVSLICMAMIGLVLWRRWV